MRRKAPPPVFKLYGQNQLSLMPPRLDELIPEDHKAAVELYFEHHPNEYLSIEDTELLP